MLDLILQENGLDLKGLEKEIFRNVCSLGRDVMKKTFQECDIKLRDERDKSEYRHKGLKTTTIKTCMGEVTFKRALYKRVSNDGSTEHVFLLDEHFGFESSCIGLISGNLVEMMVEYVCVMSYKETAKKISEYTGMSISPGAVWNIVQAAGERVSKIEEENINKYRSGETVGEKEVKVLFEEADGVMLSMQGTDRKKAKKQEIKVAIAYEGWEKVRKGRFVLHKKEVICAFENITDFKERKDAKICSKYNIDEIGVRIFNSDGAEGLVNMHDGEDVIMQLDPFHVKKAIIRATTDKGIQKHLKRLYEENKTDELLIKIDAYANSIEDAKAEEKLRKLYDYLNSNKKNLTPYLSRGLKLPDLGGGLEYRGMGACEHNVYLIIAKRMKHFGASWSRKGANNLGKLLALKVSNKLEETLNTISRIVLPVMVQEEVDCILSGSKAPESDGKGYVGKRSAIPFTDVKVTNGRKAIKNMFNIKSFAEMSYK